MYSFEIEVAMIIGAMKCGTTSLYNYLIQHPQICPALVKEPEFFSEHQNHRLSVQSYADIWKPDPKKHKVVLEASTGYTKYPLEQDIPKKILDYGLSPKFIYCVRNPFERIVSQHLYAQQFRGWGDQRLTASQLIDISNYDLQMQHFLKFFKKESILIVDFLELKFNTDSILQSIFDFLNLTNYPVDYSVRYNQAQNSVNQGIALEKVLSDDQYQYIKKKLQRSMENFRNEFGFDIEKWNF